MSRYDTVAHAYDEAHKRPTDEAEDRAVQALLPVPYLGGLVVDLGCGTGWAFRHLTRRWGRFLAIDPSIGMLDRHPTGPGVERIHSTVEAVTATCRRTLGAALNAESTLVVSTFGSLAYVRHGDLRDLLSRLRGARVWWQVAAHDYHTRPSYVFHGQPLPYGWTADLTAQFAEDFKLSARGFWGPASEAAGAERPETRPYWWLLWGRVGGGT